MSAARDADPPPARLGRLSRPDQLADAVAARIDAESAAREAESERSRAEADRRSAEAERAMAQTEASRAVRERNEALERAEDLERELAEARAALDAQETATSPEGEPGPDPAAAPEPAPRPQPEPAAYDGPVIATPPEGQDVVHFAPRGTRAGLVVVLGLAALVAAGVTVWEAYENRLAATPGVTAGVVTLVLVVVLSRIRTEGTSVSIDHGVVAIDTQEGRRRFDLTNPGTLVQLVGKPGESGWKVLLILEGKAPYTIDRRMVDPPAFTAAVRRWRPTL